MQPPAGGVLVRHDFNSSWLALEFGVSLGDEALNWSREQWAAAGRVFELVEVRCPSMRVPAPIGAPDVVVHSDTQISYSVPTQRGTELLESIGQKVVVSEVGVQQVTGDRWQPFAFERYGKIAGVDDDALARRYVTWAGALARQYEEISGCVEMNGEPVGYFFATPTNEREVTFSLAVGLVDSNCPEIVLYAAALDRFNARGFRRASASFSATNVGALNIHAQLQCRFTGTTEIFIADLRGVDAGGGRDVVSLINLNFGLEGRVAIVTGGTRGIGLSTARALALAGMHVVVVGRSDLTRVAHVAESLSRETGALIAPAVAESREPGAIQALYQFVRSEFGRLDVLVNNAGVMRDAPLGMIADEFLSDSYSINVSGSIHHLQAASRLMRRTPGGSIINISSVVGVRGHAGQVVYSSTKAAILGMTLSSAKELAIHGIRVNAVAPGVIQTDLTADLRMDELIQNISMGRIGNPEDVADVVLFLASDLSRYVTAQVIGVDGGLVM